MTHSETLEHILDVAHEQLQTEGFASLRYGEIASQLGITRAAIHHHFPQKVDLVRAVINRYIAWTERRLAEITAAHTGSEERLQAYTGLYREVLESGVTLHCPGGMLAAEIMTLPPELSSDVKRFFQCHVDWIETNLAKVHGSPILMGSPLGLVSFLQGALLVSRLNGSVETFDHVVRQALPAAV